MNILNFMYLAFYFITIYLSLIWIIVFFGNEKNIFKNPVARKLPPITFLVPAYNEEDNIENCLDSLLKLDYPKNRKKIIVINDGSSDNTANIVKKFKKYGIRLLNKKNEGKGVALNYAMKYVNTELVSCMDADTRASPDYLKKMIGYFKDPKVAAVTPAIKSNKQETFIQRMQWVEYLISLVFRKIFSLFDCQFAVPGAGGVYKTSILRKIGPFDHTNLTEDMEIAIRMQEKGYIIENSLNAYVTTETPRDFKGLYRQRMRWYRGYLSNFKKYSHMVFKPKYGNFGFFFMPITILWTIIIITLLLLQVGTIGYELISNVYNWNLVNDFYMQSSYLDLFRAESLLLGSMISLVFGFVLTIIGIKYSNMGKKIKGSKLPYLLYLIIYPYLFAFLWFCAILQAVLRAERKW